MAKRVDETSPVDRLWLSNPDLGVHTKSNSTPMTMRVLEDLNFAKNFFNKCLFGGQLSDCALCFTRNPKAWGYFARERLQSLDGETSHEIALNAEGISLRSDRENLATLVHELVHQWRYELGPADKQGRRGATPGYHCTHWARKMEEVGLIPTSTGLPNGKKTGFRITHFILPGGPFDQAYEELQKAGFRIRWGERIEYAYPDVNGDDGESPFSRPQDIPGRSGKKRKSRVRFMCPSCELKAYAKPSAKLRCDECDKRMLLNEPLEITKATGGI